LVRSIRTELITLLPNAVVCKTLYDVNDIKRSRRLPMSKESMTCSLKK
jgi:hypothetical protein